MKDSDEQFLLDVYASTRQDELDMLPWTDIEKAEFVQMQFDAQRMDYNRRFPRSQHSIVVVDGRDAGRTWVDRGTDEIRLLDIALLPEFRGMKVGTQLILWLLVESETSGTPLRHAVHKTNLGAIRFYQRLGFVPVEDFQTHDLMEWTGKLPGESELADLEEVLD